MRKERELLARVLGSRTFMQGVALRREIEQLLTQPEQEPVVWCTEDYDSTLTNAGRAQHIIKYGSPPTYYPIPLYLNPQNSKCLDISKIVMPNSTPDPFEYRDGFEDGVEYAEKHHKIGCTG